MTLLRQLIIAVLALFVVLYAGNVAVSLYNTRTLVAEQMQVHAQDTATSVALSVTQAASRGDKAQLDTLFNAVSDSGFYQRVYFADLDDQILVDRTFVVKAEGVPGWFIGLVDLPTYRGRAEVTSGWVRLGEVVVVSHPGQAYMKLWDVMTQQLVWFAAVTILVCLLAFLAIRFLLKPLARVEAQADAIHNQDFVIQETLPRTRELRSVVQAMNRMATKLREIFASQVALIERLQNQAFRDPVTGLSNRADFDARLDSLVSDTRGHHAGCLMIFAVGDLSEVNQKLGRDEGNRLLKDVGDMLDDGASPFPGSVVARRQGPDFTVLVPDVARDEAEELAGALFSQIRESGWVRDPELDLTVNMGFTFSDQIRDAAELLTEADVALRQAISEGSGNWCDYGRIHGSAEVPVLGRPFQEWRAFIEKAIADKAVVLHYQPVCLGDTRQVEGLEVFCRFLDHNNEISAGIVAPIAERLGLGHSLDQLVLESLQVDVLSGAEGYYAVNLCSSSLQSETFATWLEEFLRARPALAKRLVFEIDESAIHAREDDIRRIDALVTRWGGQLAIDNFGLGSSAFNYLASLPLAYLKVHQSFVRGIENNADNQFYIQALLQLASSRDIDLVAEGVETEAEWQTLRSLGVAHCQGYFLGHPEPMH